MKKKILAILLSAISACSLVACGEPEETSTDAGIDVSELKDGAYYVQNDKGELKQTILNEKKMEDDEVATADNSRVIWFTNDYKEIPTLYKGDKLLYYATESMPELITWERYESMGSTIGICGLTALESGKYVLDSDKSDSAIEINSDAAQIYEIGRAHV